MAQWDAAGTPGEVAPVCFGVSDVVDRAFLPILVLSAFSMSQHSTFFFLLLLDVDLGTRVSEVAAPDVGRVDPRRLLGTGGRVPVTGENRPVAPGTGFLYGSLRFSQCFSGPSRGTSWVKIPSSFGHLSLLEHRHRASASTP